MKKAEEQGSRGAEGLRRTYSFFSLSPLLLRSLAPLLLSVLWMVGCVNDQVEKPELNGTGPLAIVLDKDVAVPDYHNPLEWWKRNHMEIVNIGDYSRRECMLCHNAETSCNNCHRYVGVKEIEQFE